MSQFDELFILIKSMSQAEKRYFKIFSKRHVVGQMNNYVVLFDIIDKLDKYDEKRLLANLKKKQLSHNLSMCKTQLYNLILRSMRNYYDEKSIERILTNSLWDVNFLYEKGLINKCNKILKKIKSLAQSYEKPFYLLEALKFERKIERNLRKKTTVSEIDSKDKIEQNVISHLSLEQKLRNLNDIVYRIVKANFHYQDKDKKQLLSEIETQISTVQLEECKTFRSQILYNCIKSNICQLNSDIEGVFEHMENQYIIYKSNPQLIEDSGGTYIKFLNNYMNACTINKKFDKFPMILETINNTKINSQDEEVLKFENTYYLEQLYYLNTNQFEKAKNLIPTLEAGMKKYARNISNSRKQTISYNIVIIYFLYEEYGEATVWINSIMQMSKDSRKDLQNAIKLLELICQYELENFELLHYLLRNTKRFFDEKNPDFALGYIILKLFRKSLKKQLSKEDYKICLNNIYNSEHIQPEFAPYEELEIWLKSKISKSKMLDLTSGVNVTEFER